MIALKVYVNGKLVCTAGTEDMAVLSAIVMAVGKLGDLSHGSAGSRETKIDLRVSGLTLRSADPRDDERDSHLDWPAVDLSVGDEVRVKLVKTSKADPAKRSKSADQSDREFQKQQFEWAKKFYFANRAKYENRARRPRSKKSN